MYFVLVRKMMNLSLQQPLSFVKVIKLNYSKWNIYLVENIYSNWSYIFHHEIHSNHNRVFCSDKKVTDPKTLFMATLMQTKDAKSAFCFRVSMNHRKISIDIHTLFIVMKKHWEIESIDVGEVTKGWCMMAEWWNVAQRKMLWVIRFCHLLLYTSVYMFATLEPIWYTVIYAIYGVL